MQKLPEIISWLVGLGLPAANSRFARYEKIIDKFFSDRPDTLQDGGKQRFRDLSLAYRECIDIFVIYICFKENRHTNFINKLSQVVSGHEVPEPKEAGLSRNYLTELLVAACFQNAGYTIDFDEKTDVVARRNGITVHIECRASALGMHSREGSLDCVKNRQIAMDLVALKAINWKSQRGSCSSLMQAIGFVPGIA